MKNLTSLLLTAFLVAFASLSNAQTYDQLNPKLQELVTEESTSELLYFRKDLNIDPQTLFDQFPEAFGVDIEEMRLYDAIATADGNEHFYYQQNLDGVEIIGGQYSIHKNVFSGTYYGHGNIIKGIKSATKPGLSKESAIQYAMKAINSSIYAWEIVGWEEDLKQLTKNPDTSYYPQPKLVFLSQINLSSGIPTHTLAFEMLITSVEPAGSQLIWVDAHDGAILKNTEASFKCTSPVQVNTVFDGAKQIRSEQYTTNEYRLTDDCQDGFIRVKKNTSTLAGLPNPLSPDITSSNNTWTTNDQVFGATLLWIAKMSYSYFLNRHQIQTYNNNGGNLRVFTNGLWNNDTPKNGAETHPTFKWIWVGEGDDTGLSDSYATLDIVGHEYAHLVNYHMGHMTDFTGETRTFHESFADIFGECIEAFANNGIGDWIIGEQRGAFCNPNRSLRAPKTRGYHCLNGTCSSADCGQPDTYQGDNWESNGWDLYTNTGVQNHFFYLLAKGSLNTDGVNDMGFQFSFNGIGILKAEKIAFATLLHMDNNVSYSNIRDKWILGATDCFGAGSAEVEAVKKAWCAVGISGISQCVVANIPQNNNCTNASQVTSNGSCNNISGSTDNASNDGFSPCAGNSDDDVWYRFNALSSTHTITVDGGSDFTPVIDLWSGGCNGGSMQCANAANNGGVASMTVNGLSIGQEYLIRVYDYLPGGGSFQICITHPTNSCVAQNNNSCYSPTNLSIGSTCTFQSGDLCGATQSISPSTCSGTQASIAKDVWYTITPNSNQTNATIICQSGTQTNTVLGLYSGTCPNFSLINCVNSTGQGGTETINATLTASTTYFIRVYDQSGNANGTDYQICALGTGNGGGGCVAPTTQASNITFPYLGDQQMVVQWQVGSGNRRVVKVNTSNSFSAPANGSDPSANTNYIGGEQVVYNGNGDVVTVTGLLAGTTYWVRVYEANCTGSSSVYYSPTATTNPASATTVGGGGCSAPTTQANGISSANTTSNQMDITWNNGNGDWRLVKISESNNFTNPVNGVIDSPNNVYQNTPSEQVVYVGTANNFTVYGLVPGHTYWFRVYEANCYGTSTTYTTSTSTANPAGFTTEVICSVPSQQASNIYFSNVQTNQMMVNWANGNGTRRIVVANTSNSFPSPPNGTDPVDNPVYSGSGEQVVYNGTGSNVTVSGLNSNTWYWFRIFEANCNGSDSYYQNWSEYHESFDMQITEMQCVPPPAPTITDGEASCPGTNYGYGSTVSLHWSNTSATWYDYVIEEYPFGSSNEVFTETCHYSTSTTPAYNFERGKLYRMKVRGTTNCQDCYGNWSAPKYFHFMPELTPNGINIVDCSGTGVLLTTPTMTVAAPGSVAYQWYDGFGNQVGGNTNTYLASASGLYHVKLAYTGSAECSGTSLTGQSFNASTTVANYPAAPVLSSNSPVCEGSQMVIEANSATGGPYFWSGPNGYTYNNDAIYFNSVSASNAGTYTCYVTEDGCQSLSSTIDVVVSPAAAADFSYSVNGNDVTFTNSSSNASSYGWVFGDGNTSTQAAPTHTYATDGSYAVCLTTSSTGCIANSNCQIVGVGNTEVATDSIFARIYHPNADSAQHYLQDLIQSPIDSGFIIIGDGSQQVPPYDRWSHYMKLDKNGDVLWAREINGAGHEYYMKSIIESSNGYLVNGFFPGGSGVSSLIEIDENGNILWSKNFTDPGGQRLFDKMSPISGGVLMVGRSSGQSIGVMKIDYSGNILWQKDYSLGQIASQQPDIRFVQQTSDGGSLIGVSTIESSPPPLLFASIVFKISSDGSIQWSKVIDAGDYDRIGCAYEESNGNFILGGVTHDGTSTYECALYHLSSTGSLIDAKTIGSEYGSIRTVMKDQSEFVISTSKNYLIKMDDSFNVIHGKVMRDVDELSKSIYTLDGEIVSAQRVLSLTSPIYIYDYTVTKSNSDLDRICLDSTVTVTTAILNATSTSFSSAVTNTNLTVSNSVVTVYTAGSADSNMCSTCTTLVPAVQALGNLLICPGDSVLLAAETGMSTYLWNNGSMNDTLAVYSAGSYFVNVLDPNGCPGVSGQVQVSSLSTPFVNAGANQIICAEDSVLIGTPEISGNTYLWEPNTGVGNPNSATPTVSPTIQTEYVVTVTGANGCEAVDAVVVEVNPLPQVFPGNDQTISYGQSVTLGGNPSASGNGPFNYNWSPSNSGLNGYSLSNPSATPLSTTTYTLQVTDINGCSYSEDVMITVLGGCDYTISTNEVLPLDYQGGSGLVTITTTGNNCSVWTLNESCSWLSLDTLQGENTTNVVFDFEPNLTGQLRSCTIGLQNGQTLTVNQDGTVGVQDQPIESQVRVYPNPNSGILNLEVIGNLNNLQYEIYDGLGQRLDAGTVSQNKARIDMTQHAEGVYMLRLMDQHELLGVERIVLIK